MRMTGTLLLILILTGCQSVTTTTQEKYPPKNPHAVGVYNTQKEPLRAYRIIGMATVSKKNILGMQRQPVIIDNIMKKLAASIGGDGFIEVTNTPKEIHANVIAFQKILM